MPSAPRLAGNLSRRLLAPLFEPVDASSLAFFRIAFGLVMLVECWRFWAHGWIARYYIEPAFFFKYYGFEWVQPWGGPGMYWHFALLAIVSLMIAAGALYRLSAAVFFFAFSYVFLLDQARYLNHFYLVALIAFLMVLVPAHRAFSLDALFRPSLRTESVPGWSVWLFRLQFEVMYIYAGLVKINGDWLRLLARVAALTEEEAAELAARMDELPAGGVLGVILLLFVILLITDILGFTKVFPFTRSVR